MSDGDERQPRLQKVCLQETNMDSLNKGTPKNTENLLYKNFEYLLACCGF